MGELRWDAHFGAEARFVIAKDVSAILLTESISFEPGGDDFVLGGFAGAAAAFVSETGALTLRAAADATAATDGSIIFAARLGAEVHF
jgi:hypothetical protein